MFSSKSKLAKFEPGVSDTIALLVPSLSFVLTTTFNEERKVSVSISLPSGPVNLPAL